MKKEDEIDRTFTVETNRRSALHRIEPTKVFIDCVRESLRDRENDKAGSGSRSLLDFQRGHALN